jgi:hypothetical protein
MGRGIAAFLTLACLTCATVPLEARGLGHFLQGLLARGTSAVQSLEKSHLEKSHKAEFLTVAQLAQCIKKAKKLDQDFDQLEIIRTALPASQSEADQSGSAKDKRDKFNSSLEMHNGEVNAFNAECAKEYHAHDLTKAQELAQGN